MTLKRSFLSLLSTYVYGIILLIIIASCNSSDNKPVPPSLSKALDYFYLENHNEQALVELKKTLVLHPDKESTQLSKIFIAASICETDNFNKAALLLQQTDTTYILKNPSLKFWYLSIKGLIQFRQHKLLKAYSTLNQTLTDENFDKRALGLNQRILARICFTLGENKKGIDWLLLSSDNFKKSGLNKSIAINDKLLGRCFMNDGNYFEAFNKYLLAEKVLLKSNDKKELYYIYINLSDYYVKINNFVKAKWYADLVLNNNKNDSDHQLITLGYNKLGEIAYWQKNYNLSKGHFQEALNFGSDYTSSTLRNTNSNLGISQNYTAMKQPFEALKYAKEAQLLASSSGEIELQFDANRNLALCYNNIGMNNLAYLYQDSAIQFRDRIFKEAALSTKAFYDTRADLAKAATEMESFKQKEKKQRITFVIFIFLLSFTIVFTLVVYKLQHSKNKVLRELVKKNLEIIEDERKLSASLRHQIPIKKTIRKSIENEKSETLYVNLICFLETNKRFTQNDLSLELIAKELNTNRDYLSRAINDKKLKFNDLINKYRVKEAIKIMTETGTKKSQLKLSYICDMVGYNSNSAFIDAFKKQTGMNPAQFRASSRSIEIS